MATIVAEPCKAPYGDIPHPSPIAESSNGAQRLSALYAFVRDFPRPIHALSFRRQSRSGRNGVTGTSTPEQGQHITPLSPQGSAQRGQTSSASAVQQPSIAVFSEPKRQERSSQPNGQVQAENLPPVELTAKNGTSERVPHDTDRVGDILAESTGQPTTKLEPGGQTANQSTALGGSTKLAQAGASSSPKSSNKNIEGFVERNKGFYEAIKLRPERELVDQWRSSGKSTLDRRLKDLHLGQNVLFNLRLTMMGTSADEKSMKPTILIVCDKSRVKQVENGLKEFIRILFLDSVEFKVIAGTVRLASGLVCGLPSKPGDRMYLDVFSFVGEFCPLVVGVATSKQPDLPSLPGRAFYGFCTIGGIISAGDSMYGLTVAHSMFSVKEKQDALNAGTRCGRVECYEWSGDVEFELDSESRTQPEVKTPAIAMDWSLISLEEQYIQNGRSLSLDGWNQSMQLVDVSGFLRTSELLDDEVWVLSGITTSQIGILDTTPSSITLGQVSYEVLSIALKFPLVDGDSGSWVTRDGKLCGYIFARLEGQPWAYMLPIEPVFDEISRVLSKETKLKIDVPDAATLDLWLDQARVRRQQLAPARKEHERPSNPPHEIPTLSTSQPGPISTVLSESFPGRISVTLPDLPDISTRLVSSPVSILGSHPPSETEIGNVNPTQSPTLNPQNQEPSQSLSALGLLLPAHAGAKLENHSPAITVPVSPLQNVPRETVPNTLRRFPSQQPTSETIIGQSSWNGLVLDTVSTDQPAITSARWKWLEKLQRNHPHIRHAIKKWRLTYERLLVGVLLVLFLLLILGVGFLIRDIVTRDVPLVNKVFGVIGALAIVPLAAGLLNSLFSFRRKKRLRRASTEFELGATRNRAPGFTPNGQNVSSVISVAV